MPDVTFCDETAAGHPVAAFTLPGLPERITARELIRLRVREEVARYNLDPGPHFRGLVQPSGAEAERGRYRMPAPRRLDWEAQADVAEQAFARNRFFMLVGDRQVEDLDEVVSLADEPSVVFVKLVPLAGG
jgi:hypothetical protein